MTSAPRWARPPCASTATRRASCGSSASPAPTERRRPRSWCAASWRRSASKPVCSARSSPWSGERRSRWCAPPRRRSTCRPPSGECSTAATGRARWRSRPMRSSSDGRPGSPGRAGCSRTSRRTTSTSTRAWRPTSRPSGACSRLPGPPVVNVDDDYGRRLAAELDGATTFAIDSEADIRAREVRFDRAGSSFLCETPAGTARFQTALPGLFNVENSLAAIAAAMELGASLEALPPALSPGRAGAGAVRAGRGGAGLRRARGLRPHARLARERAARGARDHRRPPARRIRSRWRPRPVEAPADGRAWRCAWPTG